MDLEGAKLLIADSGNSFQCRVANFFRELKWSVLMSPYYVDSSTDKTRELDLIAEAAYSVKRVWIGPPINIRVRLFIECKYITQGAVFWLDSMDAARAHEWIYSRTPFVRGNIFSEEHHYLTQGEQVAKLFASERHKGEENDPIFRAVNQCLNGFIHSRDRETLVPYAEGEDLIELRYPIIICSAFGDFFRASVRNATDPVAIKNNFLLEVDYAYVAVEGATREYSLVDFLEFGQLNAFIDSLEHEIEALSKQVGDN